MFSGTILMYDLREHILTCTTLTVDENRKVGSGNLDRNLNRTIEMRVVTYYFKSLFY
jgi:hypothetical protein